MLPLALLGTGEKAVVLEIKKNNCSCKADHAQICHVKDMGIREGNVIEIVKNEGKGPILVSINGSRIAIGRGMTMKILVRRIV